MLTNHLKEIISYRQLHVLDETHVMNACKEDCCYVSMDFHEDMKKAALRNHPVRINTLRDAVGLNRLSR